MPMAAGTAPVVAAHRRQFILGPAPVAACEDWISEPLRGTGVLSRCPLLRCGRARDAQGGEWALLGLAVETRADRLADPLAQIAGARTADVPSLTEGWVGRWALVGAGAVHPDAAALLAIFHGRGADGAAWASSSPMLAARCLGLDTAAAADPRPLIYERGISWYPPPRTRFHGLAALLPSATLDLATGALRPRRLLPPLDPGMEGERAVAAFAEALTTALRRLPAGPAPPWLGLTAGYDSRLILAVAAAAGIPVQPYTRISARMSVADRVLPPRLARAAGYDHITMNAPPEPVGDDRAALIAAHSRGQVSGGDAEHLRRGVRDSMDGIMFGGHGFAAVSGFRFTQDLPPDFASPASGAAQLGAAFSEPAGSSAEAALRDWLTWVREAAPEPGLDWRDRFYLEQRLAGWLGAKEQLYDAARLERFPVLNAARSYALALHGLSGEARRGSRLQVELTRRLCPPLAEFPWNPRIRHFVLSHPARVLDWGLFRLKRRLA